MGSFNFLDDENDYTLLRPFDLHLVSQGDEVCDTRGRPVSIDAAAEMMAQLGPASLRMLPEGWITGKPVYWDSELLLLDGTRAKFHLLPAGAPILGWPCEVAPDRVLEVYLDGRRICTDLLPADVIEGSLVLHYKRG